jgi:hypothetical protein
LIVDIQKILINLPKGIVFNTFKQVDVSKINNDVLKYLLLHKLSSLIYIEDYFDFRPKISGVDLKKQMAQLSMDQANEAILNMESEEFLDALTIVASNCNFRNYNGIFDKIQEYKEKLKDLYIEGLKSKHAFLRSLVISNLHTDKLRQMKFTERRNFPSLIWTSPYAHESALHYYILEKCGFEQHHLEYTNKNDFIENFPVFSEIFSGNNPISHTIKNFWGTSNPKIGNIVQNDKIVELDFKLNLENFNDFMLIEWDLCQKPILGSYICQFSDGFLIPDKNHPLTYELQPFDLTLCRKKPLTIKTGNIKIIKPLRRVDVKTSIDLVWKGVEFISSFTPFEIISDLKQFKIDEMDACDKLAEQFQTSFLPNKEVAEKHFQEFVQNKIIKELNNTYLKIIETPDYKSKVLRMIGFNQYAKIFKDRRKIEKFEKGDLKKESLHELKLHFKKYISNLLSEIIKSKEFNSIDLKVLKKFPSFKNWTIKIIYELKENLKKCKIYRIDYQSYNIQELLENYYGKKILNSIRTREPNITNAASQQESIITDEELKKIKESYEFLNLKPPIIKRLRGTSS